MTLLSQVHTLFDVTKCWSVEIPAVTSDEAIEPNNVADTYQAFSEYHQLVTRLAKARTELDGETGSPLHALRDLIGAKRAEFGEATATRNSFTMQEYRETFSDDLPTIETEGLRPIERKLLEWLGIIDPDERFRIPCHPRTNERLHIGPLDSDLEVDTDRLNAFAAPPQPVTIFHISDTHLGYRNRAKPGGRGRITWVDRADSLDAFQRILQLAIEEDIDAVVHTGDLFDHDVDQETLDTVMSSLESLTRAEIPFYFILGDHDRGATGGEVSDAADAISELQSAMESPLIVHCTTEGTPLRGNSVSIIGVDSAGIGFDEIDNGYTLKDWVPEKLDFTKTDNKEINILCLHESPHTPVFSAILLEAAHAGIEFDCVLIGHDHRPPFNGAWQTDANGIPIASAGPTIPISNHFNDHLPGYNRIRIERNGKIGVDRRELP